jgi:hypothetical protein
MKAAQKEIRSTVTVNTVDLGSRKRDEDSELMTSAPRMRGTCFGVFGKRSKRLEGNVALKSLTFVISLILVSLFPHVSELGHQSIMSFNHGLDPQTALQDQI